MNSEFQDISENIINDINFINLSKEDHHGINRYDHSLRVARKTYKICKKFKLNYVSATRAALLHDFFSNDELRNEKAFEKYRNHPLYAINNAHKYFNITGLEESIIKTHMFPITTKIPESKEALVVSLADKAASFYEYTRYKFSNQLSIIVLFIINIISLSNK